MASTGVDPSIPEKAFTKGEFVDDKNFKCFLKCMYVKMGDMTESGELKPDNLKARTPPELTTAQTAQIVDTCTKPTATDPCDIAYDTTKCIMLEAIKVVTKKN